jgi:hypothetical protein
MMELSDETGVGSLSSLDSTLLSPSHPNSFTTIVSTLISLYQRALNNPSLTASDHFVAVGNGSEKHAKRISYGIQLMYGIDFNWKVIMHLEPTAERMAERIQEARAILAPSLRDETTMETT